MHSLTLPNDVFFPRGTPSRNRGPPRAAVRPDDRSARGATVLRLCRCASPLPTAPRTSLPPLPYLPCNVLEFLKQEHELDFKPRLNTSSYVNVVFEPEELEVMILGNSINLADASVYPASVKIHDTVVNMLGELWNAPQPAPGQSYSGTGTVSTRGISML
jgi:hypothetical protein